MNIRNKILGIMFSTIIFSMMSLVIIKPVVVNFIQPPNTPQEFDTLSAYPFQTDKLNPDDNENAVAGIHKSLTRVYDMILHLKTAVKAYTTDSFYFRNQCVIAKKIADKTIGLDMTTSLSAGQNNLNDDTDLTLPYYMDSLGFVVDERDISDELGRLIDFGSQMKNEGRNFLFFMVPGKFAGNAAYQDHSKERHAQIIDALEEAGLDTIDMNDAIEKSGVDMPSLFFKTDHHWLPSTGIWADKLLCEYMNDNYNYNIDTSLFDMENYDTKILEKHFLGSQGKKVTTAYTSCEDFPIIVPKYATDLEVFNSRLNKTVKGSIQETLFDYSALVGSIYSGNDYVFYGYGEQGLLTVKNADIHDGRHILIIKTSFADCMYPYLAAAVEHMDIIDARYFKGSLQTFINKTKPDTVIMIYGVTSLNSAGDDAFDFR